VRLTPRKRYYIDSQLQGALLMRTLGYWCFCVLATGMVLLLWQVATGPHRPFLSYFSLHEILQRHSAVVAASIVLLPILLLDVLMTTNRFAGPLYRLRRSMRALAAGEHVQPVEFRDGDFWHEVADEFNAVAAYVDELKREKSPPDAATAAGAAEFEPLNRR
jgi:HAMP domain-containing protein